MSYIAIRVIDNYEEEFDAIEDFSTTWGLKLKKVKYGIKHQNFEYKGWRFEIKEV